MIPRKKNTNNAKIDAGKVERPFLFDQSFIDPKLREVSTCNFDEKNRSGSKMGSKCPKLTKYLN